MIVYKRKVVTLKIIVAIWKHACNASTIRKGMMKHAIASMLYRMLAKTLSTWKASVSGKQTFKRYVSREGIVFFLLVLPILVLFIKFWL
jgi:hypothetical protein